VSRDPLPDNSAPIGIFDSGLGGLTVVRRMQELLPHERIVYVADQAHVPYGGRDLREIRGFACGISAALLERGCKAIVMACNISSATALTAVQATHPETPVLGVILPGAQSAAAATRNRKVGVLATEGTVKSNAYTRALQAANPRLTVLEVACPAFVPLVEAGEEASPDALRAAEEYFRPMVALGVDTVVLGCTHYPFLLPVLRDLQPQLAYIDPAEQTVRTLAELLEHHNLLAPAPENAAAPAHLLTTTGDPAAFVAQLRRFLPQSAATTCIKQAAWHEEALLLPSLAAE
jgi:glutamate racemase